ncbi:MAG: carbamoyltransferase HypF [Chromatiales bacterium]|nr:carbamoyltransferase HypF [Chromatiales bacterium]
MREADTSITKVAALITVIGRVQGVGFRPSIYRMALQHKINGWVQNRQGEVVIHAEGTAETIEYFLSSIAADAPPFAQPEIKNITKVDIEEYDQFTIRESGTGVSTDIHLPPDQFTCNDCLADLANPSDRRFGYPFVNCTQCGPRYTIIEALPYDRPSTSMAKFPLCLECETEYRNPEDRRFHAEPIACPVCGPQILFSKDGVLIDDNETALSETIHLLEQGEIVAVKGIGGYHLLCDAYNDEAVAQLRQRKQRPDKPLAVMFPQRGESLLDSIKEELLPTDIESSTLISPERPIVLCKKRSDGKLAPSIAPTLLEIGAMLPYSPLHHLLLSRLNRPLVATSGNVSGEPVITDNHESEQRLNTIADAFLHHNRPILRPADDSLYRVIHHQPRPLRLGRGAAPLELKLNSPLQTPTLAVGGQMKNTIAIGWGDRVVISPHIGDLESLRSQQIFSQVINDLQQLYQINIEQIICDAHSGYDSHRWAIQQGLPITKVLHHHAHASALYGEEQGEGDWLIFSWDGTGMGEDKTLWGGESFIGKPGSWRRFASMRPFRLPGGEKAGRDPWRSALALLWETETQPNSELIDYWGRSSEEISLLNSAWQQGLNSPQSSAVGRLFDGAAALIKVSIESSYEGEAPAQLESLVDDELVITPIPLPLSKDSQGIYRCDWSTLIPMLTNDEMSGSERATIFHQSMAEAIVSQAKLAREQHNIKHIGLSGGVFQNRVLTEIALKRLEACNFTAHLFSIIPSNDGGLCYGQIIEAAALSGDNQ